MLLVLIMCFGMLPSMAVTANGDTRKVDPSTMDEWKELVGALATDLDTSQAGGVWTDKSVFTSDDLFSALKDLNGEDTEITLDSDNDFLVVLSALAANKSIIGYSYTPTDTVFVLDLSGSMSRTAVTNMVASANTAIKDLLALNRHNRVGIIAYSGNSQRGSSSVNTATVLLPLDSYTQSRTYQVEVGNQGGGSGGPGGGNNRPTYENRTEEDIFLVYSDGKVSVNEGVKDSDGNEVNETGKNVDGGTYIQNGIYQAMEMLCAVSDTTIPDGMFQAGTKRMPIMVLMSDGAPTAATGDYSDIGQSDMGNGTSSSAEMGFLTQLTAAYAKKEVAAHYDTNALFYTLGLMTTNMSDRDIAESVLDPANNIDAISEYWDDYLKLQEGNLVLTYNEQQYTVSRDLEITEEIYSDRYFEATGADKLSAAFTSIVNYIKIQSEYSPTLVENDDPNLGGYLEFIDDIGDYMEVKQIEGILLGDTFFSGHVLAENFKPDGGSLGTVEDPNAMGHELIWSIMERLGINTVKDAQGNLRFPDYDSQVREARSLVSMAYQHHQLYYNEETGAWSNYIGWYADENGEYLGFWCDKHTVSDMPAGAAYINKSYGMLGNVDSGESTTDMMHISIQVHTEIDTVKTLDKNNNVTGKIFTAHCQVVWKIPASLIPVLTYEVSIEGVESLEEVDEDTVIHVEIDEAEPIRLVFEVGLRSDITPITVESILTDEYKAKHSDGNGGYYFYTNAWDKEVFGEDDYMPSEAINTVAFFDPSEENERYYYTENTKVYYYDSASDKYVAYDGDDLYADYKAGMKFYREYQVFDMDENSLTDGRYSAKMSAFHEEISETSIKSYSYQNTTDGFWYIKKGTPHRFLEDYVLSKGTNETKTLDYVAVPSVEYHANAQNPEESYHYADIVLGNNGRMSVTPATGILLSKTVDESVTDTSVLYNFQVSGTVSDGNYEALLVTAGGVQRSATVAFANGKANVSLHAGEQLYIVGIPAGAYTVTESLANGYAVKSVTVNGQSVTVSETASLTVTDHAVTSVDFENRVVTEGMLYITKTVTHDYGAGYVIPANKTFPITVQLTNTAGAIPSTLSVYSSLTETSSNVTVSNGAFTYNIHHGEVIGVELSEGTLVIVSEEAPAGFTPTVTYRDDVRTVTTGGNVVVDIENEYTAQTVTPENQVTLNGEKILSGREWQDTDTFVFELQRYNPSTTLWTTVGERVTVKGTDLSKGFSLTEALATEVYSELDDYHYRVLEIYDSEADSKGIHYDSTIWYFNVEVTDTDMDGQMEIAEVSSEINPGMITEVTGGWQGEVEFTNTYSPSGTVPITISVSKDIRVPQGVTYSKEGFEFGIYYNDALVGDTVKTAIDGKATFPTFFYTIQDIGKTYTYTIREMDTGIDGMTYAQDQEFKVYVYDKWDGTIGAKVYFANESVPAAEVHELEAEFVNTYTPPAITIEIDGLKDLEGRELRPGEFAFLLYQTDSSYAIPDGATPVRVVNNADGTFVFEVEASGAGMYYFYIVEDDTVDLDNITFDNAVYLVSVEVKIDGSVLVAEDPVIAKKDWNASVNEILFENVYTPDGILITINGVKTLEGRDLTAEEFAFLLYAADSNYDVADGTQPVRVVNKADGSFTFEVEVQETGTYYFSIAEDDTVDADNITFDEAVYLVCVEVTAGSDGVLVAGDPVITKQGGTETSVGILFENVYTPPYHPPTGDESNLGLWLTLLFVSGLGAAGLAVYGRKQKEQEE